MAPKLKTVKEYRAMLGVGPSASRDEVQLAYVLKKREAAASGEYTEAELKEALQALTDPSHPARTGRGNAGAARGSASLPRRAGGRRHTPVSAPALLAGLAGVLLAVMAFGLWPRYGHRLRSFSPDDRVVDARTGEPFGTILEFSVSHVFANGRSGPAYRLRLEPGGAEVWYPESDVQFGCKRAP